MTHAMTCALCMTLAVMALLPSAARAEAKLPDGMQPGAYDKARWVYHYVREAPEGHPDESIARDHYLVWTVESLRPDEGAGEAVITFQEQGGPDDKATRSVTLRVDAAGCWSRDVGKDKPGEKLCANETGLEVEMTGGVTLRALTSLAGKDAVALVSPEVGLVALSATGKDGVTESWTLEGLDVNGRKAGVHDLKPVRCDWDQSLRKLPYDKPTTMIIGPKADPITVVSDPEQQTLVISRKGAVIAQSCAPDSPQSLKGWVSPDGTAYIAIQAESPVEGCADYMVGSVFDLYQVKGDAVSPGASFDSECDLSEVQGPMLMQAGDTCVIEARAVSYEDTPQRKGKVLGKAVAAFPLSGAWPPKQARGRMKLTERAFEASKATDLSKCQADDDDDDGGTDEE